MDFGTYYTEEHKKEPVMSVRFVTTINDILKSNKIAAARLFNEQSKAAAAAEHRRTYREKLQARLEKLRATV